MDLYPSQLHPGGIAVLLFLFVILLNVLRSPLRKVPGPWYARWTSWVARYQFWSGTLPQYVHSLHEKYGPVVRVEPNEVYVIDENDWQQMIHVKKEFLKSAEFYWALHPGISNVFTTVDPSIHRHYRRLLSAAMSESGLKEFYPRVEPKVRAAVTAMDEDMQQRGAVDVFKWWHMMTFDTLTDLTFGEPVGALQHGESQTLRDIGGLAAAGTFRVAFQELSWYFTPWLPIFPRSSANAKRLRHHAADAVRRHQKLVENDLKDNVRATMFSKLYRARNDESMSFEEIRDHAQIYLTAGTSTTATTLTYLVWSVCRQECVKNKLVDNLRAHLASQGLQEEFEYENIKGLTYLECVIKETLRLFPAVPHGMPRVVPAGGANLGGYYLPEGTNVAAQAYSLHRNRDVWVDAEDFVPERWEKPTKAMRDSFLPFGGGSRGCLGVHLANMQLRLATARFFLAFPNATVSSKEGMSDQDMEAKIQILLSPMAKRCLIKLY